MEITPFGTVNYTQIQETYLNNESYRNRVKRFLDKCKENKKRKVENKVALQLPLQPFVTYASKESGIPLQVTSGGKNKKSASTD